MHRTTHKTLLSTLTLLLATTACGSPSQPDHSPSNEKKPHSLHCLSHQFEENGACKESPSSASSCPKIDLMRLVNFNGLEQSGASFFPTVSDIPQNDEGYVIKGTFNNKNLYFEDISQMHGYLFIDFDTDSGLSINEEAAFTQNKEWDIAFFYQFGLLTNGGDLPGNLEISVVTANEGDKDQAFFNYTLSDATKLSPSDFYHSQLLKSCNEANILEYTIPFAGKYSMLNPFKEADPTKILQLLPLEYDGTTHTMSPTKNRFYVIRNKTKNWWYKFRVTEYDIGNYPTTPMKITLQYSRLD